MLGLRQDYGPIGQRRQEGDPAGSVAVASARGRRANGTPIQFSKTFVSSEAAKGRARSGDGTRLADRELAKMVRRGSPSSALGTSHRQGQQGDDGAARARTHRCCAPPSVLPDGAGGWVHLLEIAHRRRAIPPGRGLEVDAPGGKACKGQHAFARPTSFSATQAFGADLDAVTVRAPIGHADPTITQRVYSHAFAKRDRDLAASIGKVLAPKSDGLGGHPTAK